MIVLWGTFAAPRSSRRLAKTARIAFELAVFALATGALLAATAAALAIVFAVLVVLKQRPTDAPSNGIADHPAVRMIRPRVWRACSRRRPLS
jgi:hypothetical protein